jgi:hypothetical protein
MKTIFGNRPSAAEPAIGCRRVVSNAIPYSQDKRIDGIPEWAQEIRAEGLDEIGRSEITLS